jgi:hypothetical protein
MVCKPYPNERERDIEEEDEEIFSHILLKLSW